ncbi:MAG: hypothetical protein WBQ21_07545 [Solirubrobacteraceae bacterium]
MNVFPIQTPSEGDSAKCPNCAAAVAADQRYCLSCGQPCSPTRLAFLDVLQTESELRAPATIASSPAGYLPPLPRDESGLARLGRYSGLFGLLTVLLMCGLIGLLVGHWLAPSKAAAGPQVVKIEGGVLPAATATSPTASTPASSVSSSTSKAATAKSAAAAEAQEVKEVKEAETPKAKPKAPVKTSSSTLKKLDSSNGKAHQQEIEKLTAGDKPIETGG